MADQSRRTRAGRGVGALAAMLLFSAHIGVPASAELQVGFNASHAGYAAPVLYNDLMKAARPWAPTPPWTERSLEGKKGYRSEDLLEFDENGWPRYTPKVQRIDPQTGKPLFDAGGAPVVDEWPVCSLVVGHNPKWPDNFPFPPTRIDEKGRAFHRVRVSWEGYGDIALGLGEHRWIEATKPAGYLREHWDASALTMRRGERPPSRTGSAEAEIGRNLSVCLRRLDPEDPLRNVRILPVGREESPSVFAREVLAWERRFAGGFMRMLSGMQTISKRPISWAKRVKPSESNYANRRMPLEHMIERVNLAGMHLWLPVPAAADDVYHRNAARLVRDRLEPDRLVVPQFGNEIWNRGSAFRAGGDWAYRFALERGICRDRPPPKSPGDVDAICMHRGTALRQDEICRIWGEVLGEERVLCVHSGQAANPWVLDQMMGWNEGVRARAEAYGIAPYFCGFPIARWRAGERFTDDELVAMCRRSMESENREQIRRSKAAADKWGLMLVGYEGGQHFVIPFPEKDRDPELTRQAIRVQRHPGMSGIYRDYLAQLEAEGVAHMALLSDVGTWDKWGSWGFCETHRESREECPKLDGTLRFIEERRRTAGSR